MTEYTLADVSAGDRVTLEHDAFWVSVGGEVSHEPVTGLYFYEEQTDRNLWLCDLLPLGWRITAVVKPEPELPTEPWSVIRFMGTIPFTLDDFAQWHDPFGGKVALELYAGVPFTRLAPVPETAKAVLDRLVELFDVIDPADSDLVTAWNNVAAEFGVTLTRQGDKS